MPMPDSESVFVIPGSVLLWRIAPRPPNSAQVRPPVYLYLTALFPRPGQNQEDGGGERRGIELVLGHPSGFPPGIQGCCCPGLLVSGRDALGWAFGGLPPYIRVWAFGGLLYT